jgi:hypothetical protein
MSHRLHYLEPHIAILLDLERGNGLLKQLPFFSLSPQLPPELVQGHSISPTRWRLHCAYPIPSRERSRERFIGSLAGGIDAT